MYTAFLIIFKLNNSLSKIFFYTTMQRHLACGYINHLRVDDNTDPADIKRNNNILRVLQCMEQWPMSSRRASIMNVLAAREVYPLWSVRCK